MAYRLYTNDVKKGLTDFGDEHFHILASKVEAGITIAIVYDEREFIVTYRLEYDVLNSVHWGHGRYYDNLLNAVKKYESYGAADVERGDCL